MNKFKLGFVLLSVVGSAIEASGFLSSFLNAMNTPSTLTIDTRGMGNLLSSKETVALTAGVVFAVRAYKNSRDVWPLSSRTYNVCNSLVFGYGMVKNPAMTLGVACMLDTSSKLPSRALSIPVALGAGAVGYATGALGKFVFNEAIKSPVIAATTMGVGVAGFKIYNYYNK